MINMIYEYLGMTKHICTLLYICNHWFQATTSFSWKYLKFIALTMPQFLISSQLVILLTKQKSYHSSIISIVMKIIDMPYQFKLDYNNLIINPLIIGINIRLKETIVSKMKRPWTWNFANWSRVCFKFWMFENKTILRHHYLLFRKLIKTRLNYSV